MPATIDRETLARLRFPVAEGLELRLRPGLDIASRDGFDALCEDNPDLRIERRSNGELIVDMPTKGLTGARNALLAMFLGVWALQNGEGVAFDSSAGFALPGGATLSPDAAWVRKSVLAGLTDSEREDFLPIVPEFVVEIRSKSDRLSALREKMEDWRESGVSLGLLLDPMGQTVEIYRPDVSPKLLENPESLDCSPELPGFLLDLRAIFEVGL